MHFRIKPSHFHQAQFKIKSKKFFSYQNCRSCRSCYDGTNILAIVKADSDGNWYFDVPETNPLNGRSYNSQITASDAAGDVSNKSAVSSLHVSLSFPNSPRINRIDDNVALKKGKIANANDTGLLLSRMRKHRLSIALE